MTRLAALSALSLAALPVFSYAAEAPLAAPMKLTLQPEPEASPSLPALNSARSDYAKEGSAWWTVGTGVAFDFEDATDTNLFGAYSYFVADDIEVAFELGLWYYSQPGDDAFGLNPNLVFRWHFWQSENRDTTIYGDIGIGLLFATEDVPEGGTDFDFTPRAGIGLTHALTDDLRLQVGLRWAHVSNARISGNEDNPGRDSAMLYAGLIFPF